MTPHAPGYTPRQIAIDDEMVALGRPELTLKAALDRVTLAAHRADVEAWEYANPEAAARWLELRALARAEEARIFSEKFGPEVYAREQLRVAGFEGQLIDRAAKELRDSACFLGARDWMREGLKWCIVLSGPPGCGKTQAATWAAFQMLTRTNYAPRCVRCPQASEMPLYGMEAEEYRWRAAQAGLLVLDDLGEGEQRNDKRSAWKAWVDDVLTQRYAARKKTIITTNRSPAELTTWLGGRIVDRLNEGVMVGTNEASMRGKP